MAIPRYDEIIIPALKLLKERGVIKLKEFEAPLAKEFQLTEDEINSIYSSGNGKIFYDRISWAVSSLNVTGLAKKPKRGYCQITDEGMKLLNTPDKIIQFVKQKAQERNKERISAKHVNTPVNTVDTNMESLSDDLTPSESIEISFGKIKAEIYTEILDTIISKTPREFEKIVVVLLQKMGYGEEVQDSGEVTQQSNDHGIDGIVKEDVLGFGRIYIQAKRYKRENSIGRDDLNKFVGALAVAQSNKGVFITTSTFTKGAQEYKNQLNHSTTLVLIDGEQLAEYIYEYSLGMQTEKIIDIKKLDGDFWDAMDDDNS